MSNILEKHPGYTLLVVVVTVMTATWGTLTFILEDNKINFYKAQVESVKAETENIKSTSNQYQARIEYLEKENNKLVELNKYYLDWISKSSSPLPFFIKKVEDLTTENLAMQKDTLYNQPGTTNSLSAPNPSKYSVTKSINQSEAYLDEKTGLIVGIVDISVVRSATLQITFPDKPAIKEQINAGKVYNFKANGNNYLLIVKKIEYVYSYVTIQIVATNLTK